MIKVVYKKLGRSNVWGFAYKNKKQIEIEKSLKGKRLLACLCHEIMHICFPNASESQIRKAETIMGNTLWKQNYRKVDN